MYYLAFSSNESHHVYRLQGLWRLEHQVRLLLFIILQQSCIPFSYEAVSCASSWAGGHDQSALGSVPAIAEGGCCPADPDVSVFVYSYCTRLLTTIL